MEKLSGQGWSRRDFLKSLSLGAAALTIGGCTKTFTAGASKQASQSQGKAQGKPNFVFILIDDMGWTDVGCYGSKFYETPNIDRLAAQAMRFTDAYAACPVCSPTRASIMTGKYPARLHLTDWISGDQAGRGPHPTDKFIVPDFNKGLGLEEVTIAEQFEKADYASVAIGKWHLGPTYLYPEHQGFDQSIACSRRGSPPGYFYPYKRSESVKLDLPGGHEGEYLTDRLTEEACKWLDGNGDKPFFMYLSHYAVHIPIQGKPELIEKYERKREDSPAAEGPAYEAEQHKAVTKLIQDDTTYAAMVESVDDSVGKVMDKLEELGVVDNTVVIFMSDNGGLATCALRTPVTANVPLRAGKGWLYEGGVREPMMIKWPGVTKPGSTCSEPVTSTDFYPTILEMAGLPAAPDCHKDGLSLVPLLKGGKRLDREALYWHYPHYHSSGNRPSGSVRARDYKLIEWYEEDRVELYNLKDDLSERNDLAAKEPEKAAQLRKMLADWRKSVNAQEPTLNPIYDPDW